jgi:hypothetical protein
VLIYNLLQLLIIVIEHLGEVLHLRLGAPGRLFSCGTLLLSFLQTSCTYPTRDWAITFSGASATK